MSEALALHVKTHVALVQKRCRRWLRLVGHNDHFEVARVGDNRFGLLCDGLGPLATHEYVSSADEDYEEGDDTEADPGDDSDGRAEGLLVPFVDLGQ